MGMIFKRKIEKEFVAWKESLKLKKRALVVKGLRQIGKTTSVLEFAKANYESVVYINFVDEKTVKEVFDNNFVVDNLVRDLSAILPDARFIENKTVIIFDEIQECANARSSIKAFMLDGRFDIIATGSLIGLRGYNKKESRGVPVGFETILKMYPMDFEEYLWAKGIDDNVINYIKGCFKTKQKVSEALNKTMLGYFKEYLCVGGMPDAVNTFLLTHDMNQVYQVQRDILENYHDDFGKHLNKDEKEIKNKTESIKITEVYNSIPSQLAKENKKFMYKEINLKANAREYRNAITWLEEFGLIELCYNLNVMEMPLEGNKIDNIFKVYVADTGLFVAMLEKGTAHNILNGDMNTYKGAIFENVIADAFSKLGKKLYYFSKNLEIDFVTMYDHEVTAIEVKATNGNSKSLKSVLGNYAKYHVKSNFKLIDGNIGTENGINTIPLYMAFLID